MPQQHDATMQLSSGSLVFSVEDVLFRIPKGLLQYHSEAFASMLVLGESEDTPIVLDDPLQAFRDWVAVLISPLESCLMPTHPSATDLKRLLELLLLCHKYLAHKIEEHVLSIALPLTRTKVLGSHLDDELTIFRIVEIANILGQPDIAITARTMILDDLWSERPKDAYDALLFGEQVNDKEVIGAAYYQILVSGSNPWASDVRLTEKHRLRLERGGIRLTEAWVQISDDWGSRASPFQPPQPATNPYPHTIALYQPDPPPDPSRYWIHEVWRQVGARRYSSYDVIGRLRSAQHSVQGYHQSYGKLVGRNMEAVKANMYTYFDSGDKEKGGPERADVI